MGKGEAGQQLSSTAAQITQGAFEKSPAQQNENRVPA